MKHTILCVDDEVNIVDSLERLFRKKYRVLKATSGEQALSILNEHPEVALIISDQRMPEMTGVELLERSLKTHPLAARILLTGYTDIEAVVAAINTSQIYRYVTKPWDPHDLAIAIDRAIERVELTITLKEKNAELEKALAELKVLDSAKDQFMILINHELKTPLTSIMSFLELLNETELSAEQKNCTKRISDSSLRLKQIVDDVLKLVSAETGRLPTHKKTYDAKTLFGGIAAQVKSFAEKKKQLVECHVPSIKLKVDKEHITEVALRLLHNAIKFGDPNSTIEFYSEESEKGHRFFVRNVGSPIPAELREKVVKPFTLGENIMYHNRGLGLSLSLCQALLKLHDSKLIIEGEARTTRIGFEL